MAEAETRREIKEIFMKAIDDAVTRILNCPREVQETKKRRTNHQSPINVKVPKAFKCPLSHNIMIEPVVIGSGHTYEKTIITDRMVHEPICPKTGEPLADCSYRPNHLVNELIDNWCQANDYDRPMFPVVDGLSSHGINALLERISSPSSVKDQIIAANELRSQAKKFCNVRASFISKIHHSLTRLLIPLSSLGETVDSNPELQKNIIASLFHISRVKENHEIIANHPLVIPILTKSLKQGIDKTKRYSVATLHALSPTYSDHIITKNAETLKSLISVVKEEDIISTEAAYTVLGFCNMHEVVPETLIPTLINRIKAKSDADDWLAALAILSTQERTIEQILDLGFVNELFNILRGGQSSSLNKENAITVIYNMCRFDNVKAVEEEENKYATFTKLARSDSLEKAKIILYWLRGQKKTARGKKLKS